MRVALIYSLRVRRLAIAALLLAACGDDGVTPPDASVTPDAAPVEGTVVVDGLGELGDIAVDSASIFVVRGAEVLRVSHDGNAVGVVASAQKSPCCLTASAGDVYWVNAGLHAADFLDGSVMRLAGAADSAVVAVADVYFPSDVAVDADAIYWVEIDGGGLRRADRDGSSPTEVFWSETSKTSLATTATHLVWTAGGPDQDVVARDRTSGAMTTVSGEEYSPTDLLAIDGDLYWIEQGMLGSGLDRIRRSSDLGAPVDLAADEMQAADLVGDGARIYWITAGDGRVRMLDRPDGTASTFASGQGALGGLALHDGMLYWTDSARGAIVRAAIP